LQESEKELEIGPFKIEIISLMLFQEEWRPSSRIKEA